jgi:hypothetical protein
MKRIIQLACALLCFNQIQATTQVVSITTGVTSSGTLLSYTSYDPIWSVKDVSGATETPYAVGNGGGLYTLPSNGCGQWISPNSMDPGNYIYSTKFTSQLCTQQVTSATLNFNYIGADNQITDIVLNGHSLGWSSINNAYTSPLTQNVNFTIPVTWIISGSNTLQILVYDTPDWNLAGGQTPTALLVCGAITINYGAGLTISPSISAAATSFCPGSPLTFTGSVAFNNVTNYYWEIAQSDQYGNVTAGGFDFSSWYPGSPSGSYTFPSTIGIPCGNYYKVKFAVQNNCIGWEETSMVIYIQCNPNVVISGNFATCAGTPVTLYENYMPTSNYSVVWGNPSHPMASNVNNITVNPHASTTYSVTVTSALGCVGSASQTVTIYPNNPTFNLSDVTTNSAYFTLAAIANDPNTTISPGYGYVYFLEELNSSGATIWIENNNPAYWWSLPSPTTFNNIDCTTNTYSGTVNLPTAYGVYPMGKFLYNHIYRVTLGSWNSFCGWKQSSQLISPGSPHHATGENPTVVITDDHSAPDMSYLVGKNEGSVTGGIHFAQEAYKIHVYPNPGDGVFHINTAGLNGGEISIFDATGKKVKSVSFVSGSSDFELDMSGSPKGMYLISMNAGGNIYTHKIILQ